MAIYLKQSTASQEVALGFFVDSTDGNTEETGLTIAAADIRLHKAGGTTLTTPAAGATHISNGIYYWVADATDTNTLGPMTIYCHPTGALAVRVECCVLAANVYDSLIGGGDVLDVSTTQLAGQTVTAAAGVTFPTSVASPTNITAATGITVSALGAGVITAASIAADAITDAKVASDVTIASVTGAVGSVTGNVGGNVVGSVASVAGAVGSVTGLTASDVAAIKTQTDKFVFTVANQVNCNVQYVNDVLVNGTGAVGDEWGP